MTAVRSDGLTARILVVDDHELVRVGVTQLLQRQLNWEVCGEAGDASTALKLARETGPDLAIVDLRLSAGDGLELIKQLKAEFPEMRILVSSMQDEQLYAERALRAGATGFISKQQPAQELLVAVGHVLAGKTYLGPTMTALVVARTAAGAGTARASVELLSDREIEVFELLGRGRTVKEIAVQLKLSPKTIEYHRQRIKDKLQISTTSVLLRHAMLYVISQG